MAGWEQRGTKSRNCWYHSIVKGLRLQPPVCWCMGCDVLVVETKTRRRPCSTLNKHLAHITSLPASSPSASVLLPVLGAGTPDLQHLYVSLRPQNAGSRASGMPVFYAPGLVCRPWYAGPSSRSYGLWCSSL